MKVGIIVPQGWQGEYDGWPAERAWRRTVAVARQAERLGFESAWLFDHFHTVPQPRNEITFESFTSLSALAMVTRRIRLGHVVICNGYRNPALTAKMISTMDVLSGGRMEVGIGAGWKRDEWIAYGYGFPPAPERLGALGDGLEIISRMLVPGRGEHATYAGRYHSVDDAINVPKPVQQHVPIIVGGNGPNVTWRLAARLADELNLDGLTPEEVTGAMPVIRSRCEEIDRDPATLRISVHIWHRTVPDAEQRAAVMAAYREAGVSRTMELLKTSAETDEALDAYADACRQAGCEMETTS